MIIEINPITPETNRIRKVIEALEDGRVIVYPTDTAFGFGCDIYNKAAINKIYQLKNQDKKKSFSFICHDFTSISEYAILTDVAYRTMKRLLPGPYTFILNATDAVPRIMQSNRKTVGIRVPDDEICMAIVKQLGRPILSATVTFGEGNILETAKEINEQFGGQVELVIDNGFALSDISSIIDFTGKQPVVTRQGKGDVSEFI